MDEKEKGDPPTDDNLNNLEDSYSIPSTSSLINEDYLGFEEEELLELGDSQETHKKDESSSDGVIDCDEWQDLGKSDYAKVIFCDLYYEPVSGNVGCKFEITDNVHEDPCDYIGLFHIGFENLNECLGFKSLFETNCEDDGKLLHCDFKCEELPELDMGFYQFLYITHDKEICGASMPFEIKPERNSLSPDSVIAEKVDEDDFLLVCRGLEKKNEQLLKQLAESRGKNLELCIAKDRSARDAEEMMAQLERQTITIENLRKKLATETAQTNDLKENIKAMAEENNKIIKEQLRIEEEKEKNENIIEDLHKGYRELMKSKNEASRMAEILGEQNKSIKAENDQLKTQFCDEKIKRQLLDDQKSALEKETELLKLQVIRVHTLEEKNACLERDIAHFQRYTHSGVEEVLDLEIMVKALEQSKELASKEISGLSKMLHNTRKDVKTLTAKLNDYEKELEEKKASERAVMEKLEALTSELKENQDGVETLAFEKLVEVQKLKTKLNDSEECLKQSQNSETEVAEIQKLKTILTDCEERVKQSENSETEVAEVQKLMTELTDCEEHLKQSQNSEREVAEVQKLKTELTECEERLKQSQNSETKAKKEILEVRKELSECTLKIEQQCAVELKLQDSSKEIMDVITKADNEVSELYYLIASWKPGSLSINDFRTKKCAVLSKCGTIKDNLKILNKKSQEQLEFSIEHSISEKERDKKEAQVTLLKTQLQEKEAGNQKLNVEMSNVVQKYSELEKEKSVLKTELESVEAQLQKEDACYRKLLQEMSDVTQEFSNLEEKIKKISDTCSFFEKNLLRKERDCLILREEIEMKDDLIKSLKNEKEEEIQKLMKELADCQESLKQSQNSEKKEDHSTTKEKELQELVNDHVARLSEAAKLYKKQYKEIEKLKKKLTKSKKESQVPSSLLTEATASLTSNFSDVAGVSHDIPINILNNSSCSTPPVEVLALSRNSSDSDTGERVSEGSAKSAKVSNEEKPLKSVLSLGTPPRPNSTNERSAMYKALLTKSKKEETSIDKSSIHNNENPKLVNMQRVEDGNHQPSKPMSGEASTSSQAQKEGDSKVVCRVSICPYCKMAFKKYMPKVFLAHHITQHVLKYEKPAYAISNTASPESSSNEVTTIPEKVISNGPTNGKAETEKMYSVPCPMCKGVFYVSCKTMEALAKHLKEQHDSMMCHCCGILFDKYTSSHFIADHMCNHFQLDQA